MGEKANWERPAKSPTLSKYKNYYDYRDFIINYIVLLVCLNLTKES